MQAHLTFFATIRPEREGEVPRILTQNVPVDATILQNPTQLQVTIQQFMVQLGVGGCVEKVGDKFVLIPGNRIYEITCEPPSIIEGSMADLGNLKL
jgi:hypothetical protein